MSQFHLITDSLALDAPSAPPTTLALPAGVGYLHFEGEQPVVTEEAPAEPAVVLEPVRAGSLPRLLLVVPEGRRVRVNGQPVPRVALLGVRDQLQIDAGPILHVTLHHRPQVGPPTGDRLGQECPVCRGPLTAETTAYVCPSCGIGLHAEGEDGLDCVNVGSECPACGAAVTMTAGYAYFPEL
jgi:hypothetical protein